MIKIFYPNSIELKNNNNNKKRKYVELRGPSSIENIGLGRQIKRAKLSQQLF